MATFASARFDPSRLIVRFKATASPRTIASVLRDADVEIEHHVVPLGLYGVRTDASRRDEALRTLQASFWVANAERELIVTGAVTSPNDVYWAEQTGLRLVELPAAWDLSRGSEQVVAVLDSGVDLGHPDLEGKLLAGFDFVNGDADPSDDHGHGTAVAGIVAARSGNGVGITGVCWLCRVLPVKVLGHDGTGTTTAVAAGMVWAADRGAGVINLSLGAPEIAGALDEAVAYVRSKGVIVVAAAGNDGVATPFFPAAAPGAIGVAATDDRDGFYSWSNRGSWVAVAAPGCTPATLPGGYGLFCGTSAATPIVAGIAALALARNPSAGADAVEQAIVGSALPIGAEVRYGRVNARRALGLVPAAAPAPAGPASREVTVTGTLGVRTATRTFPYTVGAGRLSVTLRFSGAQRLSLRLVTADGRVIARASGSSPLSLARTVPSGEYAVVVSAARSARARFTLTVAHVAAAS